MRIANVAGRAVTAHGKEPIDVFEASGGRFGPSPSAVFDRWAEFRAWADVEYGPVPVVRDPAWLVDEHIGAPSPHPRQVFAIGLNYAEHARESGYDLPTTPVVFTKFPSCIVGPQHELSLPHGNVDWEVELVAVIGAHAYRIDEDQAWAVVAGLTVGQDLSERIMQRNRLPAGRRDPAAGPDLRDGVRRSGPGWMALPHHPSVPRRPHLHRHAVPHRDEQDTAPFPQARRRARQPRRGHRENQAAGRRLLRRPRAAPSDRSRPRRRRMTTTAGRRSGPKPRLPATAGTRSGRDAQATATVAVPLFSSLEE